MSSVAPAKTATESSCEAAGHMEGIKEILYPAAAIAEKCKALGERISRDYAGKEILVVGLLRGAYMFLSDLVRHITVPVKVDFMIVSSYAGTRTTGSIRVAKDLSIDPSAKHVLVVEDLIDTGTTLAWLNSHLSSKGAASVEICTLISKTARRSKKVTAKYIGFEDCPDAFIVGYGMDFKQYYRNLPFVGVLREELYTDIAELTYDKKVNP